MWLPFDIRWLLVSGHLRPPITGNKPVLVRINYVCVTLPGDSRDDMLYLRIPRPEAPIAQEVSGFVAMLGHCDAILLCVAKITSLCRVDIVHAIPKHPGLLIRKFKGA